MDDDKTLIPGHPLKTNKNLVKVTPHLFEIFFHKCPLAEEYCIYYRKSWGMCMLMERPVKELKECPDKWEVKYGNITLKIKERPSFEGQQRRTCQSHKEGSH